VQRYSSLLLHNQRCDIVVLDLSDNSDCGEGVVVIFGVASLSDGDVSVVMRVKLFERSVVGWVVCCSSE
jgi:hypothetical protein